MEYGAASKAIAHPYTVAHMHCGSLPLSSFFGPAKYKNGLPLVMFHHKDRPEISVHLRCHLVCRQKKRPLCGMPTHPCSVTGAARPGILRLHGGSPCPQRSICRPAFCPFPSSGLSGSALCGVISVSTVYKHLTRFCRDCQGHIIQKIRVSGTVFRHSVCFAKKFLTFLYTVWILHVECGNFVTDKITSGAL